MRHRGRVLVAVVAAASLTVSAALPADATPSVYWTDQFGGSDNDVVTAVTTTPRGNVLAVGTTSTSLVPGYTPQGGIDLFVVSYDRSGDRQWAAQFGSPGQEVPARTLVVAPNGDVIVAGTVSSGAFAGFSAQGGEDVFVVRLNRKGKQLWAVQYGSSGNDEVRGVALSASGDIYLAITSNAAFPNGSAPPTSTYGEYDAVIAKLDRKGRLKWSRSIGSSERESTYGIATNRRGEVFLVGWTGGLVESGGVDGAADDGFIACYDRSGNQKWVRQTGQQANDGFYAVATTPQGDAVVAGLSNLPDAGTIPGYNSQVGGFDGIVAKYSRKGVLVWVNQHGTTGNDKDTSIAVARNGQIYVGGLTEGTWVGYTNQGGTDGYVAHLTPSGTAVSARQLGTAGNEGLSYLGVSVAALGSSRVAFGTFTTGTLWGHSLAGAMDAVVGVIPRP